MLRVFWRQGLVRRTRWRFWHHLASVVRRNPGALVEYITVCALNEHFLVFRRLVRLGLDAQLDAMRVPAVVIGVEPEPAVVGP